MKHKSGDLPLEFFYLRRGGVLVFFELNLLACGVKKVFLWLCSELLKHGLTEKEKWRNNNEEV